MGENKINEVVPTLFNRETWDGLLNPILENTDSHHLHLILFDQKMRPIDGILGSRFYNASDADQVDRDYLNYAPTDPRIINSGRIPLWRSVDQEPLYDIPMQKSSLYNEFLKLHNSQQQSISRIPGVNKTTALMAIMRDKSQGQYSPSELKLLNSYLPLIGNVINVNSQLLENKLIGATYESLLAQKQIGVVFVTARKQIVECSSVATSFLKEAGGLSDDGNVLSAHSSEDQKRLNRLFRQNDEKNSFLSRQTLISRADTMGFLKVTVHPLANFNWQLDSNEAQYVVLISSSKPKLMLDELVADYKLTKAELKLVKAIYLGSTLNEIADRNDIKLNTVRWTLANIFSKTGLNSQTALVSVLHNYSV